MIKCPKCGYEFEEEKTETTEEPSEKTVSEPTEQTQEA